MTKIERLLLANEARSKKEWNKAIQIYLDYLEEYGAEARIYWLLSQICFSQSFENPDLTNKCEKALWWIDKAIDLEPTISEYHVTRGEILFLGFGLQDYLASAASFRHALKLNQYSVYASIGLSNLIGVPEEVISISEAILLLEQAADNNPYNPLVFLKLGSLYKQAGQLSRSDEAFKNSLLCSIPLSKKYTIELR